MLTMGGLALERDLFIFVRTVTTTGPKTGSQPLISSRMQGSGITETTGEIAFIWNERQRGGEATDPELWALTLVVHLASIVQSVVLMGGNRSDETAVCVGILKGTKTRTVKLSVILE